MEKHVLSKPSAVGGVAEEAREGAEAKIAEVAGMFTTGTNLDPVSGPQPGMSTKDLHLTYCNKEAETQNEELQVQTLHLHIRALEHEKGSPVSSRSTCLHFSWL